MKIAIVSPSVQPLGGGERYPIELAHALSKLKTGFEVELVSFRDVQSELKFPNVKILPGYGNHPFNPIPRVRDYISELKSYDIIHVHQVRAWSSQLAFLFRQFGLLKGKVVVTDHGGGGRGIEKLFGTSRFADAGCAVSFTSYALSFSKVSWTDIVYGGYDDTVFYAPSEPKVQVKGPSKGTICYSGRVIPYKGLDVLAEAVPGDVRLLIAGKIVDEDYYDKCVRIMEQRGINYEYVGVLGDDDIRNLYWESDLSVLPSRRYDKQGGRLSPGELFPLSLIESVACGTPFVSTNGGGAPELAAITMGGWIIPENSVHDLQRKITSVLEQPDIRSTTVRNGLQAIDYFSWPRVAERVIDVYKRVLER